MPTAEQARARKTDRLEGDTMAEKTDYYEPSLDDVQRVIDETLDTAADGVDPMFPIEDLGQCLSLIHI